MKDNTPLQKNSNDVLDYDDQRPQDDAIQWHEINERHVILTIPKMKYSFPW